MKFGIIKERKNPPDRRVVLYTQECKDCKKISRIEIIVEKSQDRFFTDEEY